MSSLPAHLVKATGAVEISEPEGALTLADRKLFNFLLAHAYRGLCKGDREHRVYLSEIRSFAAEIRDGTEEADNRRLKQSVKRLQRVLVEFNYLDSDRGRIWESSQLLGPCKTIERTGELVYTFPEQLAERLVEPALYSFISLRVTYQFSSKYGLILYEVLKRYADRNSERPFWAVKTSELRSLLGCRDKLKDWKDFRRRALNPALEEINELAEFQVEMDEVRQGGGRGGGRVISVVFHVDRKERDVAEQTAAHLEKPKIQRRGEKAIKAEERAAAAAMHWLASADASTRMRWAKEAEALGVVLPPAATAVEQLGQWVPAIASFIVRAERLKVPTS